MCADAALVSSLSRFCVAWSKCLPFSRPSQSVLGNRGTHFDIHGVAIGEAIILFIPMMYAISFVAQPDLAYFLSACGSWVQLFVSLPSLVLLRPWHGPSAKLVHALLGQAFSPACYSTMSKELAIAKPRLRCLPLRLPGIVMRSTAEIT
jgi:hypothetical protein